MNQEYPRRGVPFPFAPRFEEAMKSGVKICTSRSRRYGWPGDTFQAFGMEFEIIRVQGECLEDVQVYFWKEEGAESPEDFEKIWVESHPREGFDPEQIVYVHWFRVREKPR